MAGADSGGAFEAAGRLGGPERLVLQLRAIGYSAAQISELVEQPPQAVASLLDQAAARLGTADQATAIQAARRCRLIV